MCNLMAEYNGIFSWAGSSSHLQQNSHESVVKQWMVLITCLMLGAGDLRWLILSRGIKCFTLPDLKLWHPTYETKTIVFLPSLILPPPCHWPGLGASRAQSTPGGAHPPCSFWVLLQLTSCSNEQQQAGSAALLRCRAAVRWVPTTPRTTPASGLPGFLHEPLFPSPVTWNSGETSPKLLFSIKHACSLIPFNSK